MKKFFFNKIEKNKITTFYDLIISLLFGGLKILIIWIVMISIFGLITNYIQFNYNYSFSIISSIMFLLLLSYIILNRIPNQFIILKNYFNTNHLKKINTNPIKKTTVNYKQMNFLDFLKHKRNFIIKFLIINFVALFVNIFHIEGIFYTEGCNSSSQTKHALFTKETVTIYHNPFNEETSGSSNGEMEIFTKSYFYPFVPFFEHNLFNGKSYCSNSFYGIFAFYDYSEFMAYFFMLFVLLYFYWDKKVKII